MVWFILILMLALIVLLARLLYIKYEIVNITKQLKHINKSKTESKVTVGLLSRDFEELAAAINGNIEIRKQCEGSRIRTENSLKAAIADMSHDLRTPLTSVIGYLQFMKLDNVTSEEREEYLDASYQRARALESLLNDFYTLSLIDSAEYEISLEKLDLSRTLRELLADRHSEFAFRNLDVNLQIPEKKVYIIGDKRSVDRVVENLLSNVLKYAKDKVEISLEEKESTVILNLSNNVTNLNPENLERIFDRFYMADKTRSGKGTGLGLSIAKVLMEKMSGDIKVTMIGDMLNMSCEFRSMQR
jgi:signal transduction histidine kinase